MLNKAEQARAHTDELLAAAAAARYQAYAPYSRFRVGAAVLTAGGQIFTGCNVENVSYGLAICAERVAVFKAAADGEREVVAVAVVIEGEPAFPCGACLQVIQEFAGEEPPVIIAANTSGAVETKRLSECLPCAFTRFTSEK